MRSPLPHRSPFVMLDEIVERVPGQRASAVRLVTSGDPLLRDTGILSEVMLVEVMAQCAGIASVSEESPTGGVLVAVDHFQVHRAVRPGDRLAVQAKVVKRMGAMVQASVSVDVAGTVCAEARVIIRLGHPAGAQS